MGGGEPRISYGESTDLRGGDSFLLCSDGLWGYFSDVELAGVVACLQRPRSDRVLIERARSRANGEGDNVSVAILKLVEIPAAKINPGAPGFFLFLHHEAAEQGCDGFLRLVRVRLRVRLVVRRYFAHRFEFLRHVGRAEVEAVRCDVARPAWVPGCGARARAVRGAVRPPPG